MSNKDLSPTSSPVISGSPEPAIENFPQSSPSKTVDGFSSYHPSKWHSRLRQIMPGSAYFHVYTWCTIAASLCGFSFGIDTSSIGPITVMPQFVSQFGPISPTLQGLIISSILITASVISFSGASIADRISRTYTIALGCFIFAIGSLLCATTNSLAQLFVGRAIAGIGEGLFMSTTTVYVCEIAPANVRGRLACIYQLIITFGIAGGYFICYGTVRAPGAFSWRFPFAMQAVFAFILACGIPFLPHSPRWLKHVGRTEEAERAWARLGFSTAEVEKEEDRLERADGEQLEDVRNASHPKEKDPWYKLNTGLFEKDTRLRTFLGCFLMGMQQATGIDGVLYYAPVLFSQAGLKESTASFLASGVSGLLNVSCTFIALFFMDRWGRRPTIIWGGSVISVSMLGIGSLYASRATDHTAGRWVVIALIYIFIIAFSMSWAVVNRLYCSEIQPMRTRAVATSLGQCANWIVNWIIAFTTPLFLAKSSYGPYFLFGGSTFFTVVICLLLMPESKGLTLEALDEVFRDGPWKMVVSRLRLRGGRRRARGSEENDERDGIALRPISARVDAPI